jgi:DNA-binding transcriptional ArsR family regulator
MSVRIAPAPPQLMEPTSPPDLPAKLRTFLYVCIDSVDQVDLLMRLRGLGKAVTVRELSSGSDVTSAAIRHHLDILTARGLLDARAGGEMTYRFAPSTIELRRYTELLAEYHGTQREAVIRFISSRAARTFADAFKLRKEP